MANSTNIIGDLNTVAAASPTAASTTKAIAAAGPILDLTGAINLAVLKARELANLCTQIKASSDSGDANYYTTITNVIGTLGS